MLIMLRFLDIVTSKHLFKSLVTWSWYLMVKFKQYIHFEWCVQWHNDNVLLQYITYIFWIIENTVG